MKTIIIAFILGVGLLSFGQEVENELSNLANKLIEVNGSSLLDDMSPSMDDLQRIFVSSQDVSNAYIHIQYLDPIEVSPSANQTVVAIYKLNGSELNTNVESPLPEQYYAIADHIKDNISVYIIEYHEPEVNEGYQVHAFFYVKEHWVFIPNAYEIFLSE